MSDMRSVEEIAGELYALPPAEFTAARDAAVATARGSGDRAAATQLAALKRPTQGAHLVNLLALRRPDVVAELVALGEQIRAAQGTVPAPQVRELSTRRRSAITAALRVCRALAAEAGSGEPTAQQLSEAEATLAAAMADDDAAGEVRAGRLTRALHYAGFGAGFGAAAPVRPSGAAAVGRTPAKPEPAHRTTETGEPPQARVVDLEDQGTRRQRERVAWQRLARAEAGVGVAREQERAANEEMDRIAAEMTRLRDALDTASKRARATRAARLAAERELALARREVSPQEGQE
jgi:hypothetical protein